MRRRGGLAAIAWLIVGIAPSAAMTADAPTADEQTLQQAGIAVDGPGLLAFFRQRTLDDSSEESIRKLIRQLGDDRFPKRQEASRKLVSIGPRARSFLQAAALDEDPEIARRARDCLRRIGAGSSSTVLTAAVRVLALRKPPEAASFLLAYLPAAEDESVKDSIRQALTALAVRDGKAEPSLLKALSDPSSVKRAAAAEALCRAPLADLRPRLRKMLTDADPRVRLRLGLALAERREKDAVPVLLALLDVLPWTETEPIMLLLERLAGATMPPVVYGPDGVSHRKYRQAWQAWWKEHRDKLRPADLERASRMTGDTLIVMLDEGVIEDLDATNRVRWKIDGLKRPLDAQLLPGEERVLIAEYDTQRIVERDRKGELLWQRTFQQGPLAAQRLANGNTFVATESDIFEVDKEGRNVFLYVRPDGWRFMRAAKLRNGDIACVVGPPIGARPAASRYVRLRPNGKELQEVKSWNLQVHTRGGRIDVLPNGHVIVPEMEGNRVVEYDGDGHSVWSIAVDHPIAAVRLPNGHTVITLMNQNRAVEVDRGGKEVWRFRAETRVNRAFRR